MNKNENSPEDPYDFNLPSLSEDPSPEEIQEHMAIIEVRAKEELGVDLSMAALFSELAQRGGEPTLMDITDLIAEKIAHAKAMLGNPTPDTSEEKELPTGAQYIFKFSITHKPDIWRTIAFNPGHSLSHVHLAIQNAFEFDNEHLYGFYMDNRVRASKKFFNDPRSGKPPYANEQTLETLNLIPQQRFLYLFNYDDSWELHVDLLEIATGNPTSPYPIILDTNGDAPYQYGNDQEGEEEMLEEDDEW
ncbi:MAG: hypothetical protein ACI8YQ_000383 [Polaribacter sp.]|jgi:hypothetical protein